MREKDAMADHAIPCEKPKFKGFQRVTALKALEFCSNFGNGR